MSIRLRWVSWLLLCSVVAACAQPAPTSPPIATLIAPTVSNPTSTPAPSIAGATLAPRVTSTASPVPQPSPWPTWTPWPMPETEPEVIGRGGWQMIALDPPRDPADLSAETTRTNRPSPDRTWTVVIAPDDDARAIEVVSLATGQGWRITQPYGDGTLPTDFFWRPDGQVLVFWWPAIGGVSECFTAPPRSAPMRLELNTGRLLPQIDGQSTGYWRLALTRDRGKAIALDLTQPLTRLALIDLYRAETQFMPTDAGLSAPFEWTRTGWADLGHQAALELVVSPCEAASSSRLSLLADIEGGVQTWTVGRDPKTEDWQINWLEDEVMFVGTTHTNDAVPTEALDPDRPRVPVIEPNPAVADWELRFLNTTIGWGTAYRQLDQVSAAGGAVIRDATDWSTRFGGWAFGDGFAVESWSADGRWAAGQYGPTNPFASLLLLDGDENAYSVLTQSATDVFYRPAISSDAAHMVYERVGPDGQSDLYSLSIQDTDSFGQPVRLTETDESETAPTWSPDAGQIAFVTQRGMNSQINLMTAQGADRRMVLELRGTVSDLAWSPAGAELAFAHEEEGGYRTIKVLTLATGRVRPVTGSGVWSVGDSRPSWSPDGRWIAYFELLERPVASTTAVIIYVSVAEADGSGRWRVSRCASGCPSPIYWVADSSARR